MNEEKLMTIAQTLVGVEQSEQCTVQQSFSLRLMIFFAVDENIQDVKKVLQKVQHIQGMLLVISVLIEGWHSNSL